MKPSEKEKSPPPSDTQIKTLSRSVAPSRPAQLIEPILVEDYPLRARSEFFHNLTENVLGQPYQTPIIIARGRHAGPTLGITAALHGNELNGIRIIHHLLASIDLEKLHGSLLCAPIVNAPAFALGQREFADGVDLNHVFPGRQDGTPSQQYAYAFRKSFLPDCQYLIDIHTASEGRINTMYVRADLQSEEARRMAMLMNPEIILHGRSGDGTLRTAARNKGIVAITVEAGNPSVFQGHILYEGEQGIRNVLHALGMLEGDTQIHRTPVICKSSKWLRTTCGGLLETHCSLAQHIPKKGSVATALDPFGNIKHVYQAPFEGIVIGMAANPVATAGTRFCHLGQVGEPSVRASSADLPVVVS
ncbi:MAG: succinylglutamate desuccinylase/aspartoacylase family protein [Myxococcales bacterium]|nr:succinylglutamate desuccinylase/aspartoacylase family protein [Myxococcales bacterium]